LRFSRRSKRLLAQRKPLQFNGPWGDEIRLHERNQGGDADDIKETFDESNLQALATLHGHNARGDWRLWVQDLAAADVGTLNRWALEFITAGQSQAQVVLEEAPGTHIPDNNPVGIQRKLTTTATGKIGSVEVSVDISHTYVGDLRISLSSPAGMEVILHDQAGGSAENLVTTYTNATTAALGNLAGQPINGSWRLNVSDRAGQDIGKLNRWRLVINRAP
jgi:subtilisin-like proprotein convertase family protein